MKTIKKIIFWSAFSISLQLAGLLFLNNYFLSLDGKVTVKEVKDDIVKLTNKKVELNIPESAKNLTLSYNGQYTAYCNEGVLNIMKNDTGDSEKVTFNKENALAYYKWLPDRDRMLIVENVKEDDSITLKLFYYDIDKKQKVEVTDLTSVDSKTEVEDIQMSTHTNDKYIKITNSSKKSSIYWVDIMEKVKKINTKISSIGSVRILQHENNLIYEESNGDKIYSTSNKDLVNVKGITNPQILAVDSMIMFI